MKKVKDLKFWIESYNEVEKSVEELKIAPSIGQINKGEIGAVMEIAWIYSCTPSEGLLDPLRGLNTVEDWKDYYNEDYVSQTSDDKTLHEFRYTKLTGRES